MLIPVQNPGPYSKKKESPKAIALAEDVFTGSREVGFMAVP
jgi:hypothetical protein